MTLLYRVQHGIKVTTSWRMVSLWQHRALVVLECLGNEACKPCKLDEAASSSKCVRCRFAWVVNSSLVSLHQADARLQKQRQQGEKLLSFETCLAAVWFVPLFSETCGDLGPKSKAVTPLHITHHVDFVAVVDRFFSQPSARMYNRFS